MSDKTTTSLKITYDKEDKTIGVEACQSKRFNYYGFGTFLENVNPTEAQITKLALDVLLAQPERGGLQGLEFWPEKRLAWASRSPTFRIPVDNINVPSGAKNWIRQMSVV